MINEAFWFFYLIGLIDKFENLIFTLVAGGIVVGALTTLYFIISYEDCCSRDRRKSLINQITKAKKIAKTWIIVAVIASLIQIVLPTKESMYAGVSQHVAEITELDQTMLQLKEVIDKKIAELESEE